MSALKNAVLSLLPLVVVLVMAGLRLRAQQAEQAVFALDRQEEVREVRFMAARWASQADPSGPVPAAMPPRSEWDACQAALASPPCARSLQAALRYLPTDGAQGWDLVETLGAQAFLAHLRAPVVTALTWGFDPQRRRSASAIHALALSEALMLPADPMWTDPAHEAELLVNAFEPLRAWYRPQGRPDPLPPDTEHRGPLPLSLAIARLRMAAQPPDDGYQRPARLAAEVDRGRTLPNGVWSEPGVAGLLALEGAAAQRVDLLPTLLDLGVDGPSPGDRIAALFAAQRLADVKDWPADHPAVARLRQLPQRPR